MDVATKQYADSVGTTGLNIKNGSTSNSVRTSGSKAESSSYTIGQSAFTEGSQTQASGNSAHAEGYYTTASADYAHAEGQYSVASQAASHAEGYYSTADATYSHAEGRYSFTKASPSHAEGTTSSTTISGTITGIDEANLQVTVSGIPSLYGHYKYALFGSSSASDINKYITAGSWASGTSTYTFTLSKWDSNLTVGGTFKIGLRSVAYGTAGHSEGAGTAAISNYSHAEGHGTITSAECQHVEGK